MLATRSLAIVLVLAASAHAGASRAWTVAKTVIPPHEEIVAGANLVNLRTSAVYAKLLPVLLAKTGVTQAKLDAIKSTCGIELVAVVESVVLAMQTADSGTIVVALKGTTRRDLEACGVKLAAVDHKTFASTAVGALSKYSGLGDQDLYVRWLAADSFAISTEANDKDHSVAATKGGFAGDKSMAGRVAAINTAAGVWAVIKRATDIPLASLNPKLALVFGTVNVAKGNQNIDAHCVLDDAQAATDLAAQANQQLAEQQKSAMGSFADILKSFVIKATGTDVAITASPADNDIASVATMALAMAH